VLNRTANTVIHKYMEPNDRSLGNTREHFRGWWINIVNLDERIKGNQLT